MERGGSSGIQFIVQIVLARLLLPEDFGAIALVLVFISVAQVFVQSGFSTALIQKKEVLDIDFSSVFYLGLVVAGFLYLVMYFAAPFISDYYQKPYLTPVFRVISITLFVGAINSIQNAVVSRHMVFKKLFFSSLGANLISGIIGITAAYLGYGVWALVASQLASDLAITVILWFTVRWRPALLFSLKRLRVLFSFGWKLLTASLLNTLYLQIRTPIIGRMFSLAELGFYNRGQQIPSLVVDNTDGAIQSVMLPALASQQENRNIVKEIVRRAIVTSSFIMFPAMIGLAAVAEPAVKIVLTEKWLPAVPFLQILCMAYALYPIHTANLQAINALGRSDIFLRLEIVKKVIGLIILAVSIPFGIYAIAWGVVLGSLISSFINAYPNLKLLNYSYLEQLKDIMPSLLISLIMGAAVYLFNFLNMPAWQILTLQIIAGLILYIGLARVFKLECLAFLITTGRGLVKSRTGG